MFKEASKQSSPVSFHLMQLFVYAEPIEAFKKWHSENRIFKKMVKLIFVIQSKHATRREGRT
jgi:hypothetical protein